MSAKILSRQQLYDLVWETPMRRLAPSFGISDVALAKHCRKAGIPLPGRGYWAKKDAGKVPPRTSLPRRGLGQGFVIEFGADQQLGWPVPPEKVVQQEILPLPAFEDGLDAVRNRASKLVGIVRFPSLANPHPLVAKLLSEDENRRAKQQATKWPMPWDVPIFDPPPEKRRLRIINALFLALARCGCKVSASRRESYQLNAQVGEVRVGFVLAPPEFDRREHDRNGKTFPNHGKLKLELDWYEPPPEIRVQWGDRDGATLESQLTDVVIGLLVAGEWGLREGLRRRHGYLIEQRAKAEEELRRRDEEARRKERERLEKIERERRDQLIAEADSWRRANNLRAYVAARLNDETKHRGTAINQALEAWAQWALTEADRIDPLCRASGGDSEPE